MYNIYIASSSVITTRSYSLQREPITHRSRKTKTSAHVKFLQEARVDATAIAASILHNKITKYSSSSNTAEEVSKIGCDLWSRYSSRCPSDPLVQKGSDIWSSLGREETVPKIKSPQGDILIIKDPSSQRGSPKSSRIPKYLGSP